MKKEMHYLKRVIKLWFKRIHKKLEVLGSAAAWAIKN